MKRLFKQNRITLIALVITIIVLLILAGISIATLTGDNGVLTKAAEAKTKTERQSIVEQARTDVLAYQMKNKGGDIEKAQYEYALGYPTTSGFRPVFKLKAETVVTGGNGTRNNPYILGI